VTYPTQLRVERGTDPAAGVEVSEQVPGGRWWQLLSMRVSLVTDANVANRLVGLTFDDGTTTYLEMIHTTAQAASVTRSHSWGPGLGFQVGSASGYFSPLPTPPLILGPGHRIRTVTVGLQAGDNYAAPALYVVDYPSLDDALRGFPLPPIEP